PARSRCVAGSAIARRGSETQYVPTAAGPAGRDCRWRRMHASLPASAAAMAPVTELRPSRVSPDRIRWPTMNDEPDKGERKKPKQDPRQDRLKLALRENLKRRKSQA